MRARHERATDTHAHQADGADHGPDDLDHALADEVIDAAERGGPHAVHRILEQLPLHLRDGAIGLLSSRYGHAYAMRAHRGERGDAVEAKDDGRGAGNEDVFAKALDALVDADGSPSMMMVVELWRPLVEAAARQLGDQSSLARRALSRLEEVEQALRARSQAVLAEARDKIDAIEDDAADAAERVDDVVADAKPWLGERFGTDAAALETIAATKQAAIASTEEQEETGVEKPHGQGASKRRHKGKRKPKVNAARTTAKLEDVVTKAPKEADVPGTITLPQPLVDGMQKAWDSSFPGGESQENSGILVKTTDGQYAWRAADPGSSGETSINYYDVGEGESLMAAGHTHPYSEREGGYTGVTFSATDLSNMVIVEERVHVVHAGDVSFMIVKTAEFDAMVEAVAPGKRGPLIIEIRNYYNSVADSTEGDLAEQSLAATKATCRKYHLAFYEGRGGTMKRL